MAVPYLSYADATVVVTWLEELGFQTIVCQHDATGQVTHAELRLDEEVVMVARDDAGHVPPPLKGHSTGTGVYLALENVDRIYDTAINAGGTSVFTPQDTEWGTRRARVLDPGGREWSFGSYVPGVSE